MHQKEQLLKHKALSEVEYIEKGKEFGQTHKQSVQLYSLKVLSNLNLKHPSNSPIIKPLYIKLS